MALDRWAEAGYDERFAMLYNSVVIQNSSWSKTAVGLNMSLNLDEGSTSLYGLGGPRSPVTGRTSQSWRLQKIGTASVESISTQEMLLEARGWTSQQRCGLGALGLEKQRRYGETTQGSGGSDNTSFVISDEGTGWDCLVEAGNSSPGSVSLIDDDDDVAGSSKGSVVCLSNRSEANVLELAGGAGDAEDSSNSTASGPTHAPDQRLPVLCETCRKLFLEMKKVKRWNKSIEYDPVSLSCDQWVLNKTWRPRRLQSAKGKLWTHLSQIRKNVVKCLETGGRRVPWLFCSRPRVFLQRNLVRCKRLEVEAQSGQGKRKLKVGSCLRVSRNSKISSRRGNRGKRKQHKAEVLLEEQLYDSPEEAEQQNKPQTTSGNSAQNVHMERACRVLNFSVNEEAASPDGWRQGDGCGPQETSLPNARPGTFPFPYPGSKVQRKSAVSRPASPQGSPGHFSWVQKGGFRSLLAELEGNGSSVVKELSNRQ